MSRLRLSGAVATCNEVQCGEVVRDCGELPLAPGLPVPMSLNLQPLRAICRKMNLCPPKPRRVENFQIVAKILFHVERGNLQMIAPKTPRGSFDRSTLNRNYLGAPGPALLGPGIAIYDSGSAIFTVSATIAIGGWRAAHRTAAPNPKNHGLPLNCSTWNRKSASPPNPQ
jgi:hypothetical protein